MRILFMGTPDIAAQSLQALVEAGHELCGVFTRMDKPVGRKHLLTAPPVKQLALEYGLPVFQPRTLKDGSSDTLIAELAPDIIVVVAYGCILPASVLHIPRYGCINLHVSLLPKYRGSAPIQWAVINGDAQTGVSIMQMDEGLDTGDVLMMTPVDIDPDETSGELFERVSRQGAQTLLQCLREIEAGNAHPVAQDHSKASLAPPLDKKMAAFSFDRPAKSLHDLIRGMNPWPVAYFECEGKKIKVLQSRWLPDTQAASGVVCALKPLTISCAQGSLQLLTVVPEGSKEMTGTAWAAGRRLKCGDTL